MTKLKLAQWKRMLRETDASQIVDFAVILPILLMVILGTLSFARAYNVYTTITYAAQEGARSAIAANCATCGSPDSASTIANRVSNRVSDVLRASAIDPLQIRQYAGSTPPAPDLACPGTCARGANNITVCTNMPLNTVTRRRRRRSATGPEACGTVVTFAYPYEFNLPFTPINQQRITLKADVQMQSEN